MLKQWSNVAQRDDFKLYIFATITLFSGANSSRVDLKWVANQSAPSTLSTVLVHTKEAYHGRNQTYKRPLSSNKFLCDLVSYRNKGLAKTSNVYSEGCSWWVLW